MGLKGGTKKQKFDRMMEKSRFGLFAELSVRR